MLAKCKHLWGLRVFRFLQSVLIRCYFAFLLCLVINFHVEEEVDCVGMCMGEQTTGFSQLYTFTRDNVIITITIIELMSYTGMMKQTKSDVNRCEA